MLSERLIKWLCVITNQDRVGIDRPFRLLLNDKVYSAATDGRAFVVLATDFYPEETEERYSSAIRGFVSQAIDAQLKAVRVSLESIRQFSIPCEPQAVTCDECGADMGLVYGFGYWRADCITFHGKYISRDLLWHALAPMPGTECTVRIPKDHYNNPFIFDGEGWTVGLMGMKPKENERLLPYESFNEEL